MRKVEEKLRKTSRGTVSK